MKVTGFIFILLLFYLNCFSQIFQNDSIISENNIKAIHISFNNSFENSENPFEYEFNRNGKLKKSTCDWCEFSTAHNIKYNRVVNKYNYAESSNVDFVEVTRPFQSKEEQHIAFYHYDSMNRVILIETAYEKSKDNLLNSLLLDTCLVQKSVYDSVFYYPSIVKLTKYDYLNDSTRIAVEIFGFNENRSTNTETQTRLKMLNSAVEWQNCSNYQDSIIYSFENNLLYKVFVLTKNEKVKWKEYHYQNGLISKETIYDLDKNSKIQKELFYRYKKYKRINKWE